MVPPTVMAAVDAVHELSAPLVRALGDANTDPFKNNYPLTMEDWQEHRDDLDALFFSERDLHARGSELHSDAYDFVERWSRYRQVGLIAPSTERVHGCANHRANSTDAQRNPPSEPAMTPRRDGPVAEILALPGYDMRHKLNFELVQQNVNAPSRLSSLPSGESRLAVSESAPAGWARGGRRVQASVSRCALVIAADATARLLAAGKGYTCSKILVRRSS